MARAIAISPDIAKILNGSSIADNVVTLPFGKLDRPTYEAVNKVLVALGGKWDRKRRGHVFPFDPKAKIASALGDGNVTSRQQSLQLFETPADLADRLVAQLDVTTIDRCLEPSAGRGRIVAALAKRSPELIAAVEIDTDNGDALKQQGLTTNLFVKDFLDFNPAQGFFTVVAMNPPFRGNQDIRHVMRAYSMLAPGGRLAAIVSEHGFTGRERECVEWREWLSANQAKIEMIPAGAFSSSGTKVQTRMVLIGKPVRDG